MNFSYTGEGTEKQQVSLKSTPELFLQCAKTFKRHKMSVGQVRAEGNNSDGQIKYTAMDEFTFWEQN